MRIYFEDGELYESNHDIPLYRISLDAKNGYSYCIDKLEYLNSIGNSVSVYTNFLEAIDNEFSWNEELKVPEVYLRNKSGKFVRIDTLTERQLRYAHNIVKMYRAGAFEE